jgi:hypothetical protein
MFYPEKEEGEIRLRRRLGRGESLFSRRSTQTGEA